MIQKKKFQKAVLLRKSGYTYREIGTILHVSKSTLSYWLRDVEINTSKISKWERTIKKSRASAIKKTREIKRRKREARFDKVICKEKKYLQHLSQRELYLCGLFLYWGEGAKVDRYTVSMSNTDPDLVRFYIYWLVTMLGVTRKKLRAGLHLYSDMDIETSRRYWQKVTGFHKSQFIKPYIKASSEKRITHSSFNHGTCSVYVYNRDLKERILAGIKVLSEQAV